MDRPTKAGDENETMGVITVAKISADNLMVFSFCYCNKIKFNCQNFKNKSRKNKIVAAVDIQRVERVIDAWLSPAGRAIILRLQRGDAVVRTYLPAYVLPRYDTVSHFFYVLLLLCSARRKCVLLARAALIFAEYSTVLP